ncbi:hypothetical protein SUVZ_05G2330 [Saccharomyces uvarum]|uniref:Pet122p n=1 Tax=Saccharomyces uvarum TaxID=230603 RepID=A0ABN8WW81_SACUV|nr:hypothetical protein SUVZ_05G2330 [Saccharomyces uvarum]
MQSITRRLMGTDVRSRVLLSSLNGDMPGALALLRQQQQAGIDVELLHTVLARAAALAHVDTIAYVWYQHVLPRRLAVEGRLLCDMAGVALHQDKLFLPAQFLQHHQAVGLGRGASTSTSASTEAEAVEFELRRVKVEAFARGTMHSTTLSEKWKVFLQEMDTLPGQPPLRLRDFPQLTRAVGVAAQQQLPHDQAAALALFGRQPLVVKNEWSLPLLLSAVLWHVPGPAQARRVLAEFRQCYRGLPLADAEVVIKRRGFEIDT